MSKNMRNSDEMEPEEIAFNQRINAVYLRKVELPFEEVVRQYRQIEEEFAERSADEEYKVVETRRRITEWLLGEALEQEQPHAVCREIFDELVQRGFSDQFQRHTMSGIYARCCQQNGEFDAGLAVIEPLIAEREQQLQDTTLAPEKRAFWERDLATDYEIRDELKAGIRERLVPHSGKLEPEEIALTQRMNAVRFRERKDDLSFEDAVREYREIEAEFVQRAGADESQAVETKRRITESILRSAYETEQPHEVCRTIWEELVQRGFSNLELRHDQSDTYVRCCQFNREFDAGIAVLEPLITEFEQRLEDTTLTPEMRHFCRMTLDTHRRMRDKLKAGIQ
jgi:hypothetical protein